MELKHISKWFVIIGTLFIWTIKFVVRPLHLFDDPMRFFFNIAPNLFGSFLIPFGAYWFFSGRNFLVARLFRIQSSYDLRLVCIMGLECWWLTNTCNWFLSLAARSITMTFFSPQLASQFPILFSEKFNNITGYKQISSLYPVSPVHCPCPWWSL